MFIDMQENASLSSDPVLTKLNSLLFNYYYSLATIAASKSEYTLAGTYLSELLKSNDESPVLLDLQAKISARQGKFKEAEFLWKKCLKSDPDSVTAIAGLNCINKLQSSKAVRFSAFSGYFKIISLIILFSLLLCLFLLDRIERKEQLSLILNKYEAMEVRLANASNSKQNKNELLLQIRNNLKSMKGISVDGNESEVVLSFNEGLFCRGNKIKSNQVSLVKQFSTFLSPHAGKIVIRLIGSSDDQPIVIGHKFKNNNALSVSRAIAVYTIISEHSKIPYEDLLIGSLSESNSVFPNDSNFNRLRNRTVVIKITQK